MADGRLAEILTRATAQLLEQAAFLFTDVTDEEPRWAPEVVEARIHIAAARPAALSVIVSKRLAVTLTAELLGLEPDDDDAEARAEDALGEVLNMLAGFVADAALGGDPPPVIGIPAVRTIPGARLGGERADGETTVWMTTEEGEPIEVALRVGGGAG